MPENKERQPNSITQEVLKNVPLVEVGKDIKQRVPHEVETWLQKIEKIQPQKTIIDDSTGKPILSPSTSVNSSGYQLPIARNTFLGGFKKTMNDASKWLSVFILRLIKINKGNIKFKDE